MNCSGILRLALALIVAFVTAGCGSRTDLDDGGGAATGTAAFPVGTYTNCAEGFFDLGSHGDLDSSGFEAGATLTLGQSGSDLTATYVQNGITQKLDFSVTTSTSATLAPTGQLVHGFTGMCVVAPGDFGLYPGVMSTSAGALAYDAGMVFITSQGIVQVDAGTCGTLSTPGTYWIICEDRQGETAPPIEAGAPSPAPLLATGEYACRSQVATYDYIDGTNEYVSSGDSGTLKLTQTGAQLTAQYDGDSSVTGTLRLDARTATTAEVEAGQSVTAACTVPVGPGPADVPQTLPVAAAMLSAFDSAILVSFAGTMDTSSACSGAELAGSVICAR